MYQVWLPAELVIPVPSFAPSSACPEMTEITPVKYKFTAVDTLELPSWATFNESTREIRIDASKEDLGLEGTHSKFELKVS